MINTSSRHPARTIYQRIMLTLYGIALLTCFICNLAVSHSLSWFFIVFCSVALAFSVTNLPLLLPGHKLLGSAFAVTVFLYLLLYVCNLYTGEAGLSAMPFRLPLFQLLLPGLCC